MVFVDTIKKSVEELVGSAVKIFPALLTAIIILFLTRFAAQFAQSIAQNIARRTVSSKSLQFLMAKIASTVTWVFGILLACVIAFPGLRLGDIIATLGLSSVAIGFAFQDIFKNFSRIGSWTACVSCESWSEVWLYVIAKPFIMVFMYQTVFRYIYDPQTTKPDILTDDISFRPTKQHT